MGFVSNVRCGVSLTLVMLISICIGTIYATNSPSHFSAYAQVAPSSRTTRSPAPWTQPGLGNSSAERHAAHGKQGPQHVTVTEYKHAGGSKQQEVDGTGEVCWRRSVLPADWQTALASHACAAGTPLRNAATLDRRSMTILAPEVLQRPTAGADRPCELRLDGGRVCEVDADRFAGSIQWSEQAPRNNGYVSAHLVDGGPVQADHDKPERGAARQTQRVELTFDDGPDSAGNTKTILELLKASKARATFYLVGKRVLQEDNWKVVFDIAASGSWLGNHAFDWDDDKDNHIFLSGSAVEQARKILLTEWAIRDALLRSKGEAVKDGSWNSISKDNRGYIDDVIAHGTGRFRTPGFKSKLWRSSDLNTLLAIVTVNHILECAGLRQIEVSDWVHIDPKDWQPGKTKQDISEYVVDHLDDTDDSILLHSRIKATAEATSKIVGAIKTRGWSFDAPKQGRRITQIQPILGVKFSTPPTREQLHQAQAKLFQLLPTENFYQMDMLELQGTTQFLGFHVMYLFKSAMQLGLDDVTNLMSALQLQRVSGHYFSGSWKTLLLLNLEFALFVRFLDAWVSQHKLSLSAAHYQLGGPFQ